MEEGCREDGRRKEKGWKKDVERIEEGRRQDGRRKERGWKKEGERIGRKKKSG
jgi:hypothetical protein